ncbi:MAG: carboxylating nicotinate-nucleotide diphosphorylase [Pseudomonadota bacterium]|jgi:nicotinate-nucleotide pyrophosphorylase (carboxylating)|nr:carboxylating nicotinate-nucleotide diphosphorylase [Pseudomonadota bacterium]
MGQNSLPDEVQKDVTALVTRALAEDVGSGDVTAKLIAADATAVGYVVARESAVFCGRPWFDEVFRQIDPRVEIAWDVEDGASIRADGRLCVLRGPARSILTGERTGLNFLQTLSGTATVVRRFVERIRGTQARIVDTRKTLPGLRSAQKHAVTAGGGDNHRFGLYDGILIKENHIVAAGGIKEAIRAARALNAGVPLMCEAENLSEVQAALEERVDLLLLDDFPTHILAKAVNMGRDFRRYNRGDSVLEASGGISLNNVRSIADTGVDRISIGGLTKHVQAVDLSMRLLAPGAALPDINAALRVALR